MEESPQRLGRKAERSDAMDNAVRYGLVVYGVLHVMVAWLAIEVALGDYRAKVSSQGAFHQLAQGLVGRIALVGVAAGLLLMVAWQGLEAFAGHADRSGWGLWLRRLRSGVTAVIYGFLAVSALRVVIGSGSSSRHSANSMTARAMDLPAGQVLVGLVGVIVFAVGVGMGWHSLSGGYTSNLSAEGRRGDSGRLYLSVGGLGYLAKGVGACLVGAVICYAAITHDPQKSGRSRPGRP